MPYKSDKQRKYFNANREKLEAEGVNVDEWNQSSKGLKLPQRASTKESVQMQRTEAITKMAAFVRYLGDKIPVGTKAADVGRNQARVHQLHKLAQAIQQTGNIVTAVDQCYPGKSAAYKHRVVQGLVHGLSKKIKLAKQLQQQKQAAGCGGMSPAPKKPKKPVQKAAAGMSMGMSKHPSASIAANTSPAAASGMKTTGPLSTTSPVKTAQKRQQKKANLGQGVQQGLNTMGDTAAKAMDPAKQKALITLLTALGVGGSAGMGAAVGGAAGSVAGAERGNTPEGLGRGVIRGAATGAGAGLGALGGSTLAGQMGQDGATGGLIGAGLGAGAGYLGSGALLGPAQGGQG